MNSTEISNKIQNQYSIPILLSLVVAGLLGNYFKFPIFLNIDFIFGSIFAMLALQFFGLKRGVLAGAMIAAYTYVLWNHPYAIIIMTAEVAVVGWLMQRKNVGLVLADAIYWVVIGMPLVFLFYYVVMDVPQSNVYITMSKQAINGIANALIARLIYTCFPIAYRQSLLPFREVIYNMMALFVLAPSLILLVVSSRADLSDVEQRIRANLTQHSIRLTHILDTWERNRKSVIVGLAEMASSHTPQQMQVHLEMAKKFDSNFLRIGLLNANADIVAYSPVVDEFGQRNIGKNFADRPFIPELKQTLKPMLSEVVLGRIGEPKPMVSMLAPVVVQEEYKGYVSGILSLEQIREHFGIGMDESSTFYTLLDKTGKVILTNRSDQKVMKAFYRDGGALISLDPRISQWVPDSVMNKPVSERWKNSLYTTDSSIGNLAEWKLLLEQPLAPFQKTLIDDYGSKLNLILVLMLVSLILAEFLSRKSIATTEKLRKLTQDLPIKLSTDEAEISWPVSSIRETNQLVNNFKSMWDTLREKFHEIRLTNQTLEQQINQRTEELRESKFRWKFAVEGSGDGMWDASVAEGNVLYSTQWKEMLGYTENEVGNSIDEWKNRVHPDDKESVLAGMQEYLDGKVPFSVSEHRLLCKNGSYKWVLGRGIIVSRTEEGKPLRLIGTIQDISNRKQAEEKQHLAASVFLHTNEGIAITDADANLIEVNDSFTRITGFNREDVLGKNARILKSDRHDRQFFVSMWLQLLSTGIWSGEIWNRHKDGEIYPVLLTINAVYDFNRKLQSYVGLLTDISQIKRNEQQLLHMAHFDMLTNVPNRVLLSDRMQQAIAQCQRHKLSMAVAYLDLDGFKAVNDRHGHDIGDELLIAITQRLKTALR